MQNKLFRNCRLNLAKSAFTLAEVLITLAIIGVVAAMTIPTLVTKINETVRTRQTEVITKRFVNGLSVFNTMENGLSSRQYANTKEFLEHLSKHMKMTAICGTENLSDCFPYSKINVVDNDKTTEVEISSLTTAAKLKLSDDYLAPAAFITAAGTPFLVSYDKNCLMDPDKPISSIPACVVGFYDYNGSKLPNEFSLEKDVIPFNGARIETKNCIAEDGDICITSAYKRDSSHYLNASEGTDLYNEYLADKWPTLLGSSRDYWVWANEKCKEDGGHLPSMDELAALASQVYKGNPTLARLEYKGDVQFDENSPAYVALSSVLGSDFNLWSADWDSDFNGPYYRYFTDETGSGSMPGNDEYNGTVCFGDN